jgi:Fe2+ transport system protein FeoA
VDAATEELTWITAIGVAPGEVGTILRRGLGRGPVHLALGNDAEFAIGYELALAIRVVAEG